MTKSAVQELFDTVYQWGSVGVDVDHTAPYYKRMVKAAAAELQTRPKRAESLNFYEQIPTCAADQEPIADLEHAFESQDGTLYHSRDCASDDALIADALCIIEVAK